MGQKHHRKTLQKIWQQIHGIGECSMKEFIDKLIERLSNEYLKYNDGDWNGAMDRAISIVNELAEEYKQDKTFQYVLLQTDILKRMGIDVSCKWETATQNDMALEHAYMRGRQDEINRFAELQEEHNNGWIPCSERLPNKEEYLKDDGRFIVTDGNRRYQSVFDIYSQVFRTSVFTTFGSYRYEEDKCVIAWQPLPAPYAEGE